MKDNLGYCIYISQTNLATESVIYSPFCIMKLWNNPLLQLYGSHFLKFKTDQSKNKILPVEKGMGCEIHVYGCIALRWLYPGELSAVNLYTLGFWACREQKDFCVEK